MWTLEITPDVLQVAAEAVPADSPIYMVNLLRYKDQADYADPGNAHPRSGREAYAEGYVPAFRKIAAEHGVEVFYLGNALTALVGPDGEQWDDVGIVKYPSFAAFRRIVESAEYKTSAEPHRLAALADWRLIATARVV